MAFDSFISTPAFKKSNRQDSSFFHTKELAGLQLLATESEKILNGYILNLMCFQNQILDRGTCFQLLQTSVFKKSKEDLCTGIREIYENLLFNTPAITELKNGVHNLHPGGTEALTDFSKLTVESSDLFNIELHRMGQLLQELHSTDRRSIDPLLASSTNYFNFTLKKNGSIIVREDGSNPLISSIVPILQIYEELYVKSMELDEAACKDLGYNSSVLQSPASSILPHIDSILMSSDPDVLSFTLLQWIRSIVKDRYDHGGQNTTRVLQEIYSLLSDLGSILRTSHLRYFIPIFCSGSGLHVQRTDLAFNGDGVLRTPQQFYGVFNPKLLATVLKTILGIVHFDINFPSWVELLTYVHGNTTPSLLDLTEIVEGWITGKDFLNLEHLPSSPADKDANDQLSARNLHLFHCVLSLINGPHESITLKKTDSPVIVDLSSTDEANSYMSSFTANFTRFAQTPSGGGKSN